MDELDVQQTSNLDKLNGLEPNLHEFDASQMDDFNFFDEVFGG